MQVSFGPLDEAEVNIIQLLASDKPESEKRGALVEEILRRVALKTLRDTGEILYYDNDSGVYKYGGEERIREELFVLGAYEINNSRRGEVINTIKDKTYIDRDKFDADPDTLNLKNGILSISTGEFDDHDSKYLCLSQLPVEYNTRTSCPRFVRFLQETIEPEHIGIISKLLGYLLLRKANYEKAFMLIGEGSNGKSTLIKAMIALLGKENCSNRSLQDLTSDRFAKADLYGKKANFYLDLPSRRIVESGDFKILVSGDRTSGQRKHQQPFEFENYAKLVFSANQIPEVEDKSYAYYRRWVIIPFNRTFEGDEKDEDLIEKLTTEYELSGILNLALKGLKKLKAERGFRDIDISDIRRQYEMGASRIKSFIEEKCIREPNNEGLSIESTKLREAYRKYCREQGTSFFDEKKFGEELKALGVIHKQKMVKKKRTYYDFGIQLKEHGLLNSLDKLTTIPVYTESNNTEKVAVDSPKELSNTGDTV